MNTHHVEISYGSSAESRYVTIDGQDISKMVVRDGVTVQLTEAGPSVSLVLLPGNLDVTLNGAEVLTTEAKTEGDTDG